MHNPELRHYRVVHNNGTLPKVHAEMEIHLSTIAVRLGAQNGRKKMGKNYFDLKLGISPQLRAGPGLDLQPVSGLDLRFFAITRSKGQRLKRCNTHLR